MVAALEPSFGAINLEDIKAPECFEIERTLRERMKIPVFHDDQHGTAIIVAAAVRNGLLLQGKRIEDVKLVNTGGGAAALACLDLLVAMGLQRENVTVCDIDGVVHAGPQRTSTPTRRATRRTPTRARWRRCCEGADIFLGLSAPRVLKPEWLQHAGAEAAGPRAGQPRARDPARGGARRAPRRDRRDRAARDYPNQVNNVLCFPFIFRGALDVGATTINEAMKVAAADAIAALARVEASEVVAAAYGGAGAGLRPRLHHPQALRPAPDPGDRAGGRAARRWTAAWPRRPIADFDAYRRELERFVFRSGNLMRPVFEAARKRPRRVVYRRGRGRAHAARRADACWTRASPSPSCSAAAR